LSKSNSLAPSTKATRSSSEYEQLIKILFIFFSGTEKVNSTSALRVNRVLSFGALLTYSIVLYGAFKTCFILLAPLCFLYFLLSCCTAAYLY
jgi:hypothetical protein